MGCGRGREWRSSGRGRKSRVRKSSISIIIVLYCIYLLVNARTILLLLLVLWLSLSNGLPASRPCSLLRRDVKGFQWNCTFRKCTYSLVPTAKDMGNAIDEEIYAVVKKTHCSAMHSSERHAPSIRLLVVVVVGASLFALVISFNCSTVLSLLLCCRLAAGICCPWPPP